MEERYKKQLTSNFASMSDRITANVSQVVNWCRINFQTLVYDFVDYIGFILISYPVVYKSYIKIIR